MVADISIRERDKSLFDICNNLASCTQCTNKAITNSVVSECVGTEVPGGQENGLFWQLVQDVTRIVPEIIIVIFVAILIIVLHLKVQLVI